MTSYTAETTLAEAFIGNAAIHSEDDTIRQQAWDSLTERPARQGAAPDGA